MPLTIRRLHNTSHSQRMTVQFPQDVFLFPLALGATTHLGEHRRDIPVLREVQPSQENSITIVVAVFPGLNWYLFSDSHDNVWLTSETSALVRVPIGPEADRRRLGLELAFHAPNLTASLQ